MSFLDRLRSLVSARDHAGRSRDEPHAGESPLEASGGLPPAPLDPLGTTAPVAAPGPATSPEERKQT